MATNTTPLPPFIVDSQFKAQDYAAMTQLINAVKNNDVLQLKAQLAQLGIDPKSPFINQVGVILKSDLNGKDDTAVINEFQNNEAWNKLKSEIKASAGQNSELQNVLTPLTDNILKLHVKSRYLEYKYISANVFILVFIKNVMDLLNKFVIRIQEKSEGDTANLSELIEKLKLLVGDQPNIQPDNINGLLDKLIEQIETQKASTDELRTDFANKVMEMLTNLKGQPGPGTGGAKQQKKRIRGGSNKGRKQNGGFIRDGSHTDS